MGRTETPVHISAERKAKNRVSIYPRSWARPRQSAPGQPAQLVLLPVLLVGRGQDGENGESLWGMGSGEGLSWTTTTEKHNIIASLASYIRKLVFSAKLPVTS